MDLTIAKLRDEITKMATLVEGMFRECLKDESEFVAIVELENQINKFHTNIDDMSFKYVALKRPLARDLRLAFAIIKINSDLERIGDLAFNIKRAKMRLTGDTGCLVLKLISDEAMLMLKNAIDSFVQGDIKLASDVIQYDQSINELHKRIIQTTTSPELITAELNFDQAYHMILISSKLERIGDHCTNIAEDVIFLESGKDVRHQLRVPRCQNEQNEQNESQNSID
ncbi:MAG: phosphate signaling complex protein PhoU [Oligoflexia bacterium]|nr:phosphate signaling complex protein PhoU [Oligoflexia bacterium]